MGVLIDKKFLLKKSVIILGAICCLTAVVLNSVAMGTDFWIVSKGCSEENFNQTCQPGNDGKIPVMEVNYGLFKGLKYINILGGSNFDLYVHCGEGGLCILSCGNTPSDRQKEFDYLRGKSNETVLCKARPSTSRLATKLLTSPQDRNEIDESEFLDSGSRVTTIVFLALTIFLQLVSTGLCCFNSFKNPIEWWQGPQGIYVLNTLAVLTNLIHLAVWGALYSQKLSRQIAISETLTGQWESESTNLGYSYWLSFASLVLTILCCVAIHFRHAPRRFEKPSAVGGEDSKGTGGVILLY